MMEVAEFPHSPFHLESVKFRFEPFSKAALESHASVAGTLGVFHFAFAPETVPKDDKDVEYKVEALGSFPKLFVNPVSPLSHMAKNTKFMAGLGEKLEAFSTTKVGGLMLEVVVGAGKKSELLSTDLQHLAAAAGSVMVPNKLKSAVFVMSDFSDHHVELFLTYLLLNLTVDNRFKKDTKNEAFLENLLVFHPHSDVLSHLERKVKVLAEGAHVTKELVVAPPNYANTVAVAKYVRKKLMDLGLKVNVLEEGDCKKLEMFCFLSVGQGSKYPPKLLHAVYKPDGPVKKTLALVGKGIMFDSGGYNTKSTASDIHFMKMDMAGASAVFGAAVAVAKLKPKNVQVHFLSAMCENMVDANSYRPSDVVRASNGKTVEVTNTDAEGRVTLADSLHYASKLEPDYLVDLATLTGAQMIALGAKCAAYYSNDEELAGLYAKAAQRGGELLWRMPMLKEYKEFLKSKVADLANANFGAKAGSVMGALFLAEFVGNTKWAHVDLAGPVLDWKNQTATGYGVMTLVNFVLMLAE